MEGDYFEGVTFDYSLLFIKINHVSWNCLNTSKTELERVIIMDGSISQPNSRLQNRIDVARHSRQAPGSVHASSEINSQNSKLPGIGCC